MIKDLKVGQQLKLDKLDSVQRKTQPPPRYSEVSLIKTLAELGIGRPATFNSIVTTIQDRGYVMKVKGQLVPTFLGFAVVSLLMKKFPQFTDYAYTSTMEDTLEDVAERKISREKFLANFWHGKNGFEATVTDLMNNIDYEEIRKLSTVSLHNGYHVVYNKFGAWLQADDGVPNEKGYMPSAKLSETELVDDYLDPEFCAKALAASTNKEPTPVLGTLTSGAYQGWIVTAREGKYGAYLQGVAPEVAEAYAKGEKPTAKMPKAINHPLPEGKTLETVTFEDAKKLFAEVKLPRWSPDKKWLVGVGKKGPYMGNRPTLKAKPVFKTLPEKYDPRTVSFDEVKELWNIESASDQKPAKV